MNIAKIFSRPFRSRRPKNDKPDRIERMSPHVVYLPPHGETDRPILAAAVGNKSSLIIDAGNSPAHAGLFMSKIKPFLTSPPCYVLITHSHWDHVFGFDTMKISGLAHRETIRKIEQMARLDYRDDALDRRVAEGTEISFCTDFMKKEMSEEQRAQLVLKCPGNSFDDSISLDLGGVSCHIRHVGGDHADDISVVYIPEDKVLFLSDSTFMDIYSGPWSYSPQKLLPLIDRILTFDAEIYVRSHSLPIDRKTMHEELKELKTYAQVVDRLGDNRQEIIRLLETMENKPLTPDQSELVDYFINGIRKETIIEK